MSGRQTIIKLNISYKEIDKVKSSPIDPLPAKVITNCIETLLSYFVTIINKSFSEGNVEGLKKSVIRSTYKVKEADFQNLFAIKNSHSKTKNVKYRNLEL